MAGQTGATAHPNANILGSITTQFGRLTDHITDVSAGFAQLAKIVWLTSASRPLRYLSITMLCFAPAIVAVLSLTSNPARTAEIAKITSVLGARVLFSPITGLITAITGMIFAFAMNRGWAENEHDRLLSAERKDYDSIRSMPDLRGMAFLSSLVFIALVPVLLLQLDRITCAYSQCAFDGSSADAHLWFSTGIDLILRTAFFSIIQDVLGWAHFKTALPVTSVGRGAEVLIRFVLQMAFIATIFQLIKIRISIAQAVDALETSESDAIDKASALGRRIIPRLQRAVLSTFKDQELEPANVTGLKLFAKNAAIAMGNITDPRALSALRKIFETKKLGAWPRLQALRAIHKIVDELVGRAKHAGFLTRLTLRLKLMRLRRWVAKRSRIDQLNPRNDQPWKEIPEALRRLQAVLSNR